MVKLRLDPEDEFMHPLEEAENFNESMYFNFYDPSINLGGFVRLGNRPNEDKAEMTTCLFLPDGRAAFMFNRPPIDNNDAFDAGGMRFAVVEPFKELRVAYTGGVLLLDDPLEMAHPRKAFTSNPIAQCEIALTYKGVSPMFGGEPVADDGSQLDLEGHEEAFARGHYEQHVAATGDVTVGDDTWNVTGYGLRDHSWGPRYWQAPWWYRWLTANFDDDFGFMISIIAGRDGSKRIGGMFLVDGEYHNVNSAEITTEWKGDNYFHDRITAKAETGSETYEVTGEVMTLIPLRNRRTDDEGNELMTRIGEGMTRWTCNGRTGYGLSEYLDQVVDGRPVGLGEA